MSEFRALLEAAASRYPTKHAFAAAIGITAGRPSRVLGGEHSLDVYNCLKLAKLTGDSASRVLRVAGKADIADLIESLYGPGRPPLNAMDRDLLDEWNALTQRRRELLKALIEELSPDQDKKRRLHTASPPILPASDRVVVADSRAAVSQLPVRRTRRRRARVAPRK